MSLRNSLSSAATSWTLCSSSSWTSTPTSKSSRSWGARTQTNTHISVLKKQQQSLQTHIRVTTGPRFPDGHISQKQDLTHHQLFAQRLFLYSCIQLRVTGNTRRWIRGHAELHHSSTAGNNPWVFFRENVNERVSVYFFPHFSSVISTSGDDGPQINNNNKNSE